jgi:3-dehydroquinate dehydratase/shikimate dehydrogenase
MFVHQGARQFEIWTGKPAPVGEMVSVVQAAVNARAAAARTETPPNGAKRS